MRQGIKQTASAVLTTVAGFCAVLLLTLISNAFQRVPLSQLDHDLLLKSGLPLRDTGAGSLEEDPAYFWGQVEVGNSASGGLSPLEAKSGISMAEALGDAISNRGEAAGETGDSRYQVWYDPRIPVPGALAQIPRVARARHMSEAELRALVERHVEGNLLGILGQPRINVLDLNRALDQMGNIR